MYKIYKCTMLDYYGSSGKMFKNHHSVNEYIGT